MKSGMSVDAVYPPSPPTPCRVIPHHRHTCVHKVCLYSYRSSTYMTNVNVYTLYTILSGPLPQTVVDFWRLVWQERAPSIVMITNIEEGGKTKCQQYWPDSKTKNFGPFKVSMVDERILADYAIRILTVQVFRS